MHRSYVSKAWIDAFIINEHERLPSDVETRFFSVLRIKPDEVVAVFDGDGRQIMGTLKKNQGAYFINAQLINKSRISPEIVVIQAAIDEAKLSQTIQRGCELGVDRFIIFSGERSVGFCLGKLEKRRERLESIAQDAARQSERFFIPTIAFVPALRDVILCTADKGIGLFGDVTGNVLLSRLLAQKNLSDAPCYICVGPEGGLSAHETLALPAPGQFVGKAKARF